MNPFELNYNIDAKTISNIMLPKSADELVVRSDSRYAISHWTQPSSRASAVAGKMLVAASIAIGTMIPSMASASNIFVRDTRGTTAQTPSSIDISDMVKSAVESMPEHQLVDSETNADFVLRPRVMTRANGSVLHIDRYRGETLLSSSEESLPKVESDQDGAYSIVTNAFKGADAPAASATSDRAMNPTYGEQATQTRGDQAANATGAAHTAEMAKTQNPARPSTPTDYSNHKTPAPRYLSNENKAAQPADTRLNQNQESQGRYVARSAGSRMDNPATDQTREPSQGIAGAQTDGAQTGNQNGDQNSDQGQRKEQVDQAYNLSSGQHVEQAAVQSGNQASDSSNGPRENQNDQYNRPSQDDSENFARGTAATPATPDEPMKTATIPPSTPTPAAPEKNSFGHPMNPGAGMDIPSSDYGSSSGNEMRTDGFKRTSVFGGPGYFTAAAGAGFAGGMGADNTMVNVNAGYAIDYTPLITGKAFVDMNLGTGSDVARFIDVAVGANYYPPQVQSSKSKPYVGGDLGLGMARNNSNSSQSSLAVGATGGFQFLADMANLDVGLRYEVLATQIDGSTAQLLGLKLGMNF